MLKSYSLVREDQSPDIIEDLVRPALTDSFEVLDLLVVHFLTEPQLNHACVERVQVVQDGVNLKVTEMLTLSDDDLLEILSESLSCAERGVRLALNVACLQEAGVKTSASNVVGEPLHALVGPSFHAFHKLPLVLVVELLDALLEFDLGRPQRLDLLELLKVEERFGD